MDFVQRVYSRLVNHDPLSWNFLADRAPEVKDVVHQHYGPVLDQGNLGSCTGNACSQALNTDPFNVANTTTLAAMTAAVDRAYANKQWLIFAMHDVVTTPTTGIQMSTTNFQSLVDYVKGKGIPVKLVSEVIGTAP